MKNFITTTATTTTTNFRARLVAAHGIEAVNKLSAMLAELDKRNRHEMAIAEHEQRSLFAGPMDLDEYAEAQKEMKNFWQSPEMQVGRGMERALHAYWRSLGEPDCPTSNIEYYLNY